MEMFTSSNNASVQLSLFGDDDGAQDHTSESRSVDPKECAFCPVGIDPDADTTYHEVLTWVRGPRRDSNIARIYTGRIAHNACIKAVAQGRAESEVPLLVALESKDEASDHKELPDDLVARAEKWTIEDSDSSATVLNPIDQIMEKYSG